MTNKARRTNVYDFKKMKNRAGRYKVSDFNKQLKSEKKK